jgi:hypothetical protein
LAEFVPAISNVNELLALLPRITLEVNVTPLDNSKYPPMAAEVPPPTKDAVIKAFVTKLTFALVSMVTIKPFE